jgi:hypothetical protein
VTVIEVAIGPGMTRGTFRVEVVASPAGEASVTVELDADSLLARRGLLQQAVLASAVPRRRVLPETEQPVREVGQVLFAGLLGTGEVAGRYRASTPHPPPKRNRRSPAAAISRGPECSSEA